METKAPVGITVDRYLKHEIGDANIENVKTVLEPHIEGEKLVKMHVASDLFDYFNFNGVRDLFVIKTLKDLLGKLNREDLLQYIEAYEFLLKTLSETSGADSFCNIYKKISTEIENRIGYKDASELKREYKDVIDSVRTLHAIQSMRDLFSVLEDRDIINNSDVSILENILDKFGEVSLKKLVLSYKTILNPLSLCEICGCEIRNVSCKQKISSPAYTEDNEELENALTYLCTNLGPRWKKLARSLKINEAKIKSIEKKNMLDIEEQTVQMFNYWRHTHPDASVVCLISALKSRMCNFVYLANEIEKKTYRNF